MRKGVVCARHLVTMETPIMVTLLRPVYPSISITSSKSVCIDPVWPSVLINYCASCLSFGRLLSRLVSTPRPTHYTTTTPPLTRSPLPLCPKFVSCPSLDKNIQPNKICVSTFAILQLQIACLSTDSFFLFLILFFLLAR